MLLEAFCLPYSDCVYSLANMKPNCRYGYRRQEPMFVMLTAFNKWPSRRVNKSVKRGV